MKLVLTGREWSELGSRDIDGKAERPSEWERTSQWIKELGIYDYRHRMYHPGLGRFLQSDPTGFDAGDMNLFRYCDDDPVDGSDPTGLAEINAASDIWNRLRGFDSSFARQTSLHDENDKRSREVAHQESLKQLREMIKGTQDSTAKIFQRGHGEIQATVYGGEEETTQKAVHEYVKIHIGDRIWSFAHVHTHRGKEQANLSDYDEKLLKFGRPMYFITRDWVTGRFVELQGTLHRANYVIVQPNGAMTPYLDPQLTLSGR